MTHLVVCNMFFGKVPPEVVFFLSTRLSLAFCLIIICRFHLSTRTADCLGVSTVTLSKVVMRFIWAFI